MQDAIIIEQLTAITTVTIETTIIVTIAIATADIITTMDDFTAVGK